MALVFTKKAKLLPKKNKKFKNKKYKHYSYSLDTKYVQYKSTSNPHQINSIAMEVFGSLYFNPSKD